MSRFKVGQTVWSGRGEHLEELVIEKVHKNPLIPVRQYTFVGKGFASGEQSLRATKDGRDLTIKECMVNDKEMEFRFNTLGSSMRQVIGEREAGMMDNLSAFDNVRVNFKPSLQMCEWLRDYADGRLIIHVDSGQGHLVRMLKMTKARVMGIEPNINKEWWIKFRMQRNGEGVDLDINEILQGTLEQRRRIVEGLGNNALLVFTRPKDSESLNFAINNFFGKSEILLIETADLSNTDPWKKLEHEGVSEDNEVIYSLNK